MSTLSRRTLSLVVLLLSAGLCLAAADPPARVGRVSYLSGNVSFHTEEHDWQPAVLNHPVTSRNALWTDAGARTEVRVGSTAIRLDGETQLDVVRLDDHAIELNVPRGSVNVRLRNLYRGESFRIATPHGTAALLAPGRYRIDADAADETTAVTVFFGSATFNTEGSTITLSPGKTALVSGTDGLSYEIRDAESDPFDEWALARDRRDEAARSARYVSPETTGYEDLDEYGDWRDTPEYGPVWVPYSVPAGWAPYRHGHWVWVSPWGWTWVDHAPWGFAPFHYGRWVYLHGYWGWYPGRLIARPVYAPALVAFIGQPGWSVSISVGSVPAVGWFPLAPFEPFYPGYRCSTTYIRNVNVTQVNVTHVHVHDVQRVNFANRKFPLAVTVVPQQTLTASRPVAQSVLPVNHATLASAPVAGMTAPLKPVLARIADRPANQADAAPGRGRPPVARIAPADSPPNASGAAPDAARAGASRFEKRVDPQQAAPEPIRREATVPMHPQRQGEPLGQDAAPAPETARRMPIERVPGAPQAVLRPEPQRIAPRPEPQRAEPRGQDADPVQETPKRLRIERPTAPQAVEPRPESRPVAPRWEQQRAEPRAQDGAPGPETARRSPIEREPVAPQGVFRPEPQRIAPRLGHQRPEPRAQDASPVQENPKRFRIERAPVAPQATDPRPEPRPFAPRAAPRFEQPVPQAATPLVRHMPRPAEEPRAFPRRHFDRAPQAEAPQPQAHRPEARPMVRQAIGSPGQGRQGAEGRRFRQDAPGGRPQRQIVR